MSAKILFWSKIAYKQNSVYRVCVQCIPPVVCLIVVTSTCLTNGGVHLKVWGTFEVECVRN
jgi:hypothetical protein